MWILEQRGDVRRRSTSGQHAAGLPNLVLMHVFCTISCKSIFIGRFVRANQRRARSTNCERQVKVATKEVRFGRQRSMKSPGKGRPIVAEKRYAGTAAVSRRTGAKPSAPTPPIKQRRSRTKPKRGLIARFFLFIWGIIWAFLWRIGMIGGMVLACAVLFFYVQ
ncbi:MAG: hypothetical protein WCS20_07630, partial [Alphaproteobacteria bacterium]